jgi:hypothetical protein
MATTVVLFATIAAFLLACGLYVSAVRDLRHHTSAGLLDDNMFEALLPEYAFSSKVPRRLQRRYLLSTFLVSVAISGMVILFFLAANYSRVIMSGFALVTTLVMNVLCWRRFRKSSPRNAILDPWR